MRSAALTLLFFTVTLQALNLEEAVERSLNSSYALKQHEALERAAISEYDGSYSAYKPTLDFKYSYTESDKENFIGSRSDSSASLELGYNLFNGFADKYGIEIARKAHEKAHYEMRAAKADLILRVKLAYISVLQKEKALEVAQESLTLLDRQLADAKVFFAQGLTAKNDYLQVEVEQLMAQQELLQAQSDLRVAKESLRRELAGNYRFNEPLEPLLDPIKALDPEALEETMLTGRSELLALKTALEQSAAQRAQLASSYYPVIDSTLKYQKAGTEVWPDGGQNFKSNDETSLNIALTWHLYAGGADEAARRAVMEQESALTAAFNDLKLSLTLQLEQSMEAYRLAKSKMTVARKGLEQAKEHYRITQNQHSAQITSTALLLDAKRLLTQAQTTYHNAYFELFEAAATIERVTETAIPD